MTTSDDFSGDTGDGTGPSPDTAAGGPGALNETELTMLRLEQGWWKYPGAKEARIWEELGMSVTRYYQVLAVLIDNPAALAADPVTVNRLRRLREERRARRAPGP